LPQICMMQKSFFDNQATNLVMINICLYGKYVPYFLLPMTEITILVKVTMVQII
jgi:hypothetical protein